MQRTMYKSGSLKKVPAGSKGLKKLPTPVRNKMGFMSKGGRVKKAAGGGLYANIKAKQDRIKGGSGETMRKVGSKGAPTAANFKRAAKTAKA
tara:strand:+ start:296 stop:571 length:276 start_codon:yes stop_codon:yes gene_type:complete